MKTLKTWMMNRSDKGRRILAHLIWHSPTEVGEFLLGLTGFLWGLWVLNPYLHTFAYPSYVLFWHLAPEPVWGIIYTFVGLLTMYSVYCYNYVVRRTMTLINVPLWALVTVSFFISNPANTGAPMYFLLTLAAIWLHIRVRFRSSYKYEDFH